MYRYDAKSKFQRVMMNMHDHIASSFHIYKVWWKYRVIRVKGCLSCLLDIKFSVPSFRQCPREFLNWATLSSLLRQCEKKMTPNAGWIHWNSDSVIVVCLWGKVMSKIHSLIIEPDPYGLIVKRCDYFSGSIAWKLHQEGNYTKILISSEKGESFRLEARSNDIPSSVM